MYHILPVSSRGYYNFHVENDAETFIPKSHAKY